uniref:Pecanex-like protein n=2 Tax=Caenorhabditis tropicalis TaxID=1561998 RepID=A0A1I7UGS7_9PELO
MISQWFECLVARLLIIPYQEGWISIKDTVVEDSGHFEVSLLFIPLLIGGFLRAHYILSLAMFIPCIVIERIIASIFIRTYEKHPRMYVSTSLLTVSHIISVLLSYYTIQWKYSYFQILITFTLLLSSTVTLAYRILVCIGIYIFLLCIILFTLFFDVFPSLNLVLVFLVENCIYLNPLLICTVTMCSVDPWRAILIRDIDILSCRLLRLNRTNIHRVRSIEEKMMAREETDIYFRDLKVMWA